jgi:competence protein ComGC
MFKTDKYYNNLYYKVIPSVVVLSIISILLLLNFIKLLRTNQL